MNDPRRHPRPRRAHGFTIMELLICLGLVTIAMNVGIRLLHTTIRLTREAPAASRELRMQAQWLTQLREDAWRSQAPERNGDASVGFTIAADRILWRQDKGLLIREAAGDLRTWPMSTPLRWSESDGLLTVSDGTSDVPLATPARGAVPQ